MIPVNSHPLVLLLCLLCGGLPFIAVHGTYLIAASHEVVPWCIPYIDSCTSISATGREAPASYLFRGLMLPTAGLMLVYWWLHAHWLQGLAPQYRQTAHWIRILGTFAAIGLILYVTVLGEIGDTWRLQRRIGVILFFTLTFLSQLLLARALVGLEVTEPARLYRTGRTMTWLCALMLLIGICSVIIQGISDPFHDQIEDAIEWQLALLLQINSLLTARLWVGNALTKTPTAKR